MTDTATATIPAAFARSEVPLTEGTGGEHRTPRSEITNIRYEGKKYEPAFAIDLSPSMFWSCIDEDDRSHDYPHPLSRRAALEAFLPLFIAAIAPLDSEAEAEQADGSDEDGGVMSAGFDAKVIEIGDLNKTNLARKMLKAWKDAKHGGTKLAPAIQVLIDKYAGEFPTDPEGSRVHEINIFTDGEPEDPEAVLPYLATASAKRVFNIGIMGHGKKAKATYDLYKKAADDNQAADKFGHRHINLILWDGVSDPIEMAEDFIRLAA